MIGATLPTLPLEATTFASHWADRQTRQPAYRNVGTGVSKTPRKGSRVFPSKFASLHYTYLDTDKPKSSMSIFDIGVAYQRADGILGLPAWRLPLEITLTVELLRQTCVEILFTSFEGHSILEVIATIRDMATAAASALT